MDSNITSFSYRIKSLKELQRQIEQLNLEIKKQKEWNDWQTTYINTLEISFQEFQEHNNKVCNNLLTQIKSLHRTLMTRLPAPKKM